MDYKILLYFFIESQGIKYIHDYIAMLYKCITIINTIDDLLYSCTIFVTFCIII